MNKSSNPLARRSRDWYTVKEAAGAVGYSEPSIRSMIADGTLAAGQRKKGAQIRIPESSVEALKRRLAGDTE